MGGVTAPVPAARRLVDWGSGLELSAVPSDVVEATKLHLLDAVGCGLAADGLGVGGAGRGAAAELGSGPSSILRGPRVAPAHAALANAMLCHALDFDDTHGASVAHITTVVAPAAIAVAEARERSGAELLTAVVAGTEAVARIGMAGAGRFHARGFHPTAVCGVFGAALAAARLDDLSSGEAAAALGLAGSMASGLLAFLDEGTETKPVNAANAAAAGVTAALLARHGAAGPTSVLEARFGLYHAFLGDDDAPIHEQLDDLGERWETLRIAIKGFPACHYAHGSLGATASLVGVLDPAEVEQVVVTVPEAAVPIVLEPARDKLACRTPYEAKFSLQYATAALLVHGALPLEAFSEAALEHQGVRELARRVTYETRRYPTYPGAFPGGVRIVARDGRSFEAESAHQPGAPENPLPRDAILEKFRRNASLVLAPPAVERLEEALLGLELLDDVRVALAGDERLVAT